MKKTMSLILSATMLVACVSCQAKSGGLNDKESQPESTVTVLEDESTVTTFEEESTTAPSQEELLPPVLFSSYDDILNTISCIAKQGGREAFETGMPTLDSREQKIYQTLCDSTSPPSTRCYATIWISTATVRRKSSFPFFRQMESLWKKHKRLSPCAAVFRCRMTAHFWHVTFK